MVAGGGRENCWAIAGEVWFLPRKIRDVYGMACLVVPYGLGGGRIGGSGGCEGVWRVPRGGKPRGVARKRLSFPDAGLEGLFCQPPPKAGATPTTGPRRCLDADPGFRPGLLEAALQAACLWELICGGRRAVFVCGGISAIGVQERDPAQGRPNLEYGASAVLPCGVIPASDLRGWFPAQERFAN